MFRALEREIHVVVERAGFEATFGQVLVPAAGEEPEGEGVVDVHRRLLADRGDEDAQALRS